MRLPKLGDAVYGHVGARHADQDGVLVELGVERRNRHRRNQLILIVLERFESVISVENEPVS